jgi:hypothetical protein
MSQLLGRTGGQPTTAAPTTPAALPPSSAPPELLDYNRGVGERATDARNAARKNLGYRQEDVDAWKKSVDAARNYRSTYYGEEYGRAAGLAYLLRRAGIRPLDRELAARGAAASATGLRPS